ncbi:SH3 domain-containing protein [Desulfovibrio aminophilus]|nr:SH3 domain-containing C40 family peptidase [Desulfovibrio aminophilus]MCM0755057.1 SH3 domain-containing protein [Desulfovibrio aminophilus]
MRTFTAPPRVHAAFPALCLLLLLSACAAKAPLVPPDPREVRDVAALPQDLFAYVGQGGGRLLFAPDVQAGMLRGFLTGYFAPWERTVPPKDPGDAFWGLNHFSGKTVYGENLLRRGPAWMEEMRRLSRPEDFPNFGRPAVAVVHTSLRVLPTLEPAFLNRHLPGEGFPFDYLQNTAVWAGTPLYLSHLSADGAFALAHCRYASGWVPVSDVAFAGPEFRKKFQAAPLVAVTRDRVSLADEHGLFRFQARVGMLLPLARATARGYEVLLPVRDAQGEATTVRGLLPPSDAAPLPLPATAANLARVGDSMLGEPYGWGGMYGHRDCSALLLDLYTPFGLGLPRNSRQQGKAGEYVSLEGLADQNKEAAILARGVPFATLLWKPGHIMLYVGEQGGRAMILHDVWGLRTEERGREGRHIIGRAAVTTLTPGEELPDLKKPEGLLLHTIRGMVLLGSKNS